MDWFSRLRDRLRVVRVCCGDWQRVCASHSVTTRIGLTGVFLDPPYAVNLERMHAWIAHLLGEGPHPDERGGLFGGGDVAGKSKSSRSERLYGSDAVGDTDHLVARVHVWCLERGVETDMRIALCGYEGEHEALEAAGWSVVKWEAQGGYGNRGKDNANKKRERVWFSPHCLDPEDCNP